MGALEEDQAQGRDAKLCIVFRQLTREELLHEDVALCQPRSGLLAFVVKPFKSLMNC